MRRAPSFLDAVDEKQRNQQTQQKERTLTSAAISAIASTNGLTASSILRSLVRYPLRLCFRLPLFPSIPVSAAPST